MVRGPRFGVLVVLVLLAACSSRSDSGAQVARSGDAGARAAAPADAAATRDEPPAADAAAAAQPAAGPDDTPLSHDAAAAPLEPALVRKVRAIRVLDLLASSRAAERRKRRRQKLVAYVAEQAAADSPYGKVQLRAFACEAHADHICVAVIGDPCAVGVPAESDCEGFYLTVVADLSHDPPILDRAMGGFGRVSSLEEIAQQRAEAP